MPPLLREVEETTCLLFCILRACFCISVVALSCLLLAKTSSSQAEFVLCLLNRFASLFDTFHSTKWTAKEWYAEKESFLSPLLFLHLLLPALHTKTNCLRITQLQIFYHFYSPYQCALLSHDATIIYGLYYLKNYV